MASSNTKKGLLTFLGIAAGFGTWFYFKKSATIDALQVNPTNLKFKVAPKFIQVAFDLLIDNPTDDSLQFKDFDGNIYLDTQSLGSVSIPNPVNIKPKSKSKVSLSTTLPTNSILQAAASVLLDNKLPSKGIIRGTVHLGSMAIPVYKAIDLSKPTA